MNDMNLPDNPDEQQVLLKVHNQKHEPVVLVVEPWGSTYTMQPAQVFEIHISGPDGNGLEVAIQDDAIVVWLWSGCIARVTHDGADLDPKLAPRIPPGLSGIRPLIEHPPQPPRTTQPNGSQQRDQRDKATEGGSHE